MKKQPISGHVIIFTRDKGGYTTLQNPCNINSCSIIFSNIYSTRLGLHGGGGGGITTDLHTKVVAI